MDNKKISQFNGHNLVDSELRTQIGEIDFGGKTLVAALDEKANASALQANKDKIAECERNINAAVTRIDNIIGSAPESFDTLKEVSEWIEAHGADFTALKNSVDNLPDINAMLQSYVTSSALNERLNDYASKSEIPTKTSQLTNDSEFLTEHQDISGLATNERVQDISDSIPTNVSQLNNDAGFIDSSALSNYAKAAEISTTYATKAEVSAVSAKLPEVPEEDGTYTLKATVVSGSVTYSWVKEA